METYLLWGYIRDIPTRNVPHFQLHYRSKSGSLVSLELGIIVYRLVSKAMVQGVVDNNDLSVHDKSLRSYHVSENKYGMTHNITQCSTLVL